MRHPSGESAHDAIHVNTDVCAGLVCVIRGSFADLLRMLHLTIFGLLPRAPGAAPLLADDAPFAGRAKPASQFDILAHANLPPKRQ